MAQLLQEYRVEARLSQRELAKRLRTSQSYVAKIENALQRVDLIEALDFVEAVGKSLGELSSDFQSRRSAVLQGADPSSERP